MSQQTVFAHPAILPDDDVVTRAQALASGDLVDVTPEARRLRFHHPLALSREVWEDCVDWDDTIEDRKDGHSAQEVQGRLREVLWHALVAARTAHGSRVHFTMKRVSPEGPSCRQTSVTLVLAIGPGDTREPVLTVRFPQEDS